ncbi:MAG: S8 family serine peptidase, partial [Bacteriovoracaceae bacterium]|nr:S8 family serine peptidase [Bacteriovoracaceae bacterium]
NAKILPVRVLGKCGGYESDIADGVRWAAGVNVSGLSPNANPAKVINMSLGGQGPCSFTMQNAINEANAKGAVVVVAAGNDNTNMNFTSYSPANCNGVLVVASTARNANRAYYSNYGNKVDISAPGGDNSGGILSTHNSGSKAPGFAAYTTMNGTSMAAPHVAGIVSLVFGVKPGLYPGQVRDIIRNTAMNFPGSSNCTTSTCGHGIADAYQAVVEAQVTSPDPNYQPNDPAGSGGISGQAPIYTYYEEDGGAGCGTIDTNAGPGGGPGGGNKMVSYLMMILLGSILAKFSGKLQRD